MSSKAVMDGNTAAAYASYPFTEVASIYPITPSSQMAEVMDEWAAKGRKNLFGQTVDVIEMQSEAGAAGTCHGSLQAGALTTTYTAAQGLVLMIPPLFRIAGEYLPGVFHVAARTVAQNYWSIYGDHSDVMACRSTGVAMLSSVSPQEAYDLGTVAHLSAINGLYTFMHFFDGFRTSHELQKIDLIDMEDLRPLVNWDNVQKFRKHALNPEHPFTRGATPDTTVFFQLKEAANDRYESLPAVVEDCMNKINALTGKNYKLFNYYGAPDATDVVVAMGSMTETLRDTVEYLNKQGRKTGVLVVHLYRPFSAKHFVAELPATVKRVAVLDRTKESGAVGEPLFLDVKSVLADLRPEIKTVIGGRAGISGKDTTPGMMISVYDNLAKDEPKKDFTVGIVDDVYFKSLDWTEVTLDKAGEVSCKIWGTGGDGTVGANKNSLKIIGGKTDMYTQAYFAYDAKKSGGVTQSHLRFGKDPIHATYLVSSADFVAVHNQVYLDKFDTTADLKQNGKFLLNCNWKPEEVVANLPNKVKKGLAEKNAKFYVIDATAIANEIGLGNRTNSILQSAFFKLIDVIPMDMAIDEMKSAIYKTYFAKYGQETVDMNYAAVDGGVNALTEIPVPAEWKDLEVEAPAEDNRPEFVKELFDPINKMAGDKLPVSVFKKYGAEDGTWPSGTSKYDKRGDAVMLPSWDASKCIQCNQCAYVCPHAAIRPFLLTEEEKNNAPEGFTTLAAKGVKGYEDHYYRLQVSPLDCLGCGMCANTCIAKDKALTMKPFDAEKYQVPFWDYVMDKVAYKKDAGSDANVKSVMLKRPYYQFPPACAGCGETEYIRLISQLFGSRMYVANASGCTAAHGGCLPSTPYGFDERGFGMPWEQSLFEDNAEFGFGFLNAHDAINRELTEKVKMLAEAGVCKAECEAYLANKNDGKLSREVTDALIDALKAAAVPAESKEAADYILANTDYLAKKSVWCFGGDGWAYDIGYGGLDHVLAMNKDINMLVLDTEVYSNTGGQSSKATPTGSTAKFAAAGKTTKKKDLGMMLMSYGYIYVAQCSMGADPAQTLKAIKEAEAYPGPSVVICYAPCTAHGIPGGMKNTQVEMKKAVESGYWTLYRYNPLLKEEGKNPFQLDCKAPSMDYLEFVRSERRYTQLERSFPERAKELFEKSAKEAADRFAQYERLAKED